MPPPSTPQGSGVDRAPVVLDLPFRGRWQARNSPARRVPSHGTHLLGTTYAIDFVGVDERGRSGPISWRTLLASEPPEAFAGFGRIILAPADGLVVARHDGEPDGRTRRSVPAYLPFALGQSRRLRAGTEAVAGNHVVLELAPHGPFVLLAHLRLGSLRVSAGQRVRSGEPLGECGNSGNSTQPHVHVQVTDSTDWQRARGRPLVFRGLGADPRVPTEAETIQA